jgi:hypothetical protein
MSMKAHKNELVGWLTLMIGKQLVLMKLRKPVSKKSHKMRNGLVAATAAGAVGAVTYLKLKPGGGDGSGGATPVID